MVNYPYNDVEVNFIHVEALEEMAQDGYTAQGSPLEELAWMLLLTWCDVDDYPEVDELFDEEHL